jgi:hypothetical protein
MLLPSHKLAHFFSRRAGGPQLPKLVSTACLMVPLYQDTSGKEIHEIFTDINRGSLLSGGTLGMIPA